MAASRPSLFTPAGSQRPNIACSSRRPSPADRPSITLDMDDLADITAAAFQTWRKSMEACMLLNERTLSVSVIHIRLNCVP
ncbi:hypothetical protein E2C01_101847 [Portunus trituberculatus]|uniref:Uncharacterized protein n=1 Tax=Portunus trituberculatus TaxID=210409 RepID=A0A5B7KGY0_PORTR|nr:hypothetical protein [Portunus trituberculatus]